MNRLQILFEKFFEYKFSAISDPFIRQIYASRKVRDQENRPIDLIAEVTPEQGERLFALVSRFKPRTSLEIGLAYGLSALYICRALQENGGTRHIAIDPLQSQLFNSIGVLNLERAGYAGLLDFHEQPSELYLPALVREDQKVEFAFIDGMHTFDHVLIDFFYIDRLLSAGGVVVFHDCQMPAIHRVLNFISHHRRYTKIPWERPALRRIYEFLLFLAAFFRAVVTLKNPFLYAYPGDRLVALIKEADEKPAWNYYHPF